MLLALDHFTVRSTDLARTLAFYRDVLGLQPGARPALGLPGAWLYAQGRPIVHVLEKPVDRHAGTFDHVGIEAVGRAAFAARLHAAGVGLRLAALPDGSALQMFIVDPDGAQIELVFRQPEDG